MRTNLNAQTIGQKAEQQACRFLESKGLQLLTKNYRCFSGEIDLIMQHDDDIVFIEVRTRGQQHFGDAIESVNSHKQKKLIKASIHYLQKKNWFDKVNCRFDVIGISQGHMEWIVNAFSIET